MTSAERIHAAKRYLRRVYANNVPGLEALATSVATSAFESVTITGSGYEGGSDTGVITFEPLEYLSALEDLISELDPTAPQPASTTIHTTFAQRNALQ